uniref:Global nitrogen transcriptional regulator n=1 Tax=Caulacanthus okamurae TaxID=152008 RepID=A0A6H1U7I1_9FLOR|nr:global nitrogen transcriptional regulator [Caulacanthus okamurae]QIZ74615.1 global nitrogen transcriptional regulator [Caulacanthus okamurae]
MRWIKQFLKLEVPFYIYKLKQGDSIIYINNNESFIILHGTMYISKIFKNKTTTALGILEAGNIINNQVPPTNCYYKTYAITDTFLLSFKWEQLINYKHYNNQQLYIQLLELHRLTIKKYEVMNTILSHKDVRNRVSQLILTLLNDTGIIQKTAVIIPYNISQSIVSDITGSTRSRINKILRSFHHKQIIEYTYDKRISTKHPLMFIYSRSIK